MIGGDVTGVTITICPACHGTQVLQIGEAALGFDGLVGGRHFFQPPYAVNSCASCGLYFKSVTLTQEQLDSYYQVLESETFEVDGNFPTDRVLHRRLRKLAAGSRVLDFGCSTGRILKDLTSNLQCFGVEPNVTAAAAARVRGIDIIPAETVAADDRGYDAILLTDVFEHLRDPLSLLRMLAGRLAPGGWFAIVTGNADAISNRDRLAEFWYFRIAGHLIMLGEQHLTWLSRHLDLPVEVHRCSHYRVGWRERLRQQTQAIAYDAFRSAPSGPVARVLRLLPRLSNAARWTTAPALNYRRDHVVAFFTRPQRAGVQE